MIKITCERCGGVIETYPSRIGRKKYCSKLCQNRSIARSGPDHHNWKGDEVGYQALHSWVRRKLGSASSCELCDNETGRFEWSNISGEYKRDTSDWRSLCAKCHRRVDDNAKKSWVTRRNNSDTWPDA